MSKYSDWLVKNIYNKNKSFYNEWRDEVTYVKGVYDDETGDGIEQVYKLVEEVEVNKTKEILDDIYKYQE